MSIADSDALESSRTLVYAALMRLREMLQAESVSRMLVPKITINKPGSMELTTESRPDWSFASSRIQEELENTPAFRQFEQAVEENPSLDTRMNTMIGAFGQRRRMTRQDFFQILL